MLLQPVHHQERSDCSVREAGDDGDLGARGGHGGEGRTDAGGDRRGGHLLVLDPAQLRVPLLDRVSELTFRMVGHLLLIDGPHAQYIVTPERGDSAFRAYVSVRLGGCPAGQQLESLR